MNDLLSVARNLREIADNLEGMVGPKPPWEDRVAEMPINRQPFNVKFVNNFRKKSFWPWWPHRDRASITGLTIHHTWSHSAINTARYCTATKGYPTGQYHFWVSAHDGCPIYLLAKPEWMIWHDSTGAYPTTLSVGMAGRLELAPPPSEQVEATANLCRHLMGVFDIPAEQVVGHRERYQLKTQCPGWGPADRRRRAWGSGWKDAFYEALNDH
jgi:hypothetical protein